MDATTFAATRNGQHQQLVTRFPNASFELAQAQQVENMIKPDSSRTFLAAVILLLPTASEAAQAAACSCESAHGDLLELAGKAAALNRQVASCLLAQHNAAGPPVHSLSPASIVGSPEHKLGAAGGGHAPPVSLNPAVQTVWDNGGSNTSRLTYELDEVDETEYQEGQLGFETQARAPVTRTLDNLMPSNRYKKKFAEEVQLGAHTAKMASGYVDVMTPTEFTFKTVPDIKFGDYKQVLDAIPEPWVQDKRFSMHGYVTHKHAVNPTGLDEEERAAHKIPQEAQKLSDTLAKEQGEVRTRLVKLQLPAAELAKHLHTSTYPFDNPKCLANSLRQQGAQEETEGTDTRSELEQFESVVHEAFCDMHEQLRVLSDRLTLASHLSFLQDYDLQMRRAAAVAPQNKQVVALAFGRDQQRSFSPHSNLPAERMKMPKTPKLEDARSILDAIQGQHKGGHGGARKGASAFFGSHGKKGKQGGKKAAGGSAAETQHATPGSKATATGGASAASGNLTWKAKNQKRNNDKKGGGHPAAEQ